MTIERKKAIVVIIATLVAGILIGVLSHAMLARRYHRGYEGHKYGHKDHARKDRGDHLRGRFVEKIFEVAKATEAQQQQLRPVLEKTAAQIDSVRTASEQEMKTIVAGMMSEITPILTPAQTEDLKKFFEKIGRHRHKK
jgi:hypothetical protein